MMYHDVFILDMLLQLGHASSSGTCLADCHMLLGLGVIERACLIWVFV